LTIRRRASATLEAVVTGQKSVTGSRGSVIVLNFSDAETSSTL
jgi:hypothetical protein